MSRFRRYALYYAPPLDAAWTATATAWLGWDVNTGEKIEHPAWPGLPLSLPEITKSPRKYGLHATVKPPFFLREGRSAEELTTACEELCQKLAPVRLRGLAVERLGRFLALRPLGDETELNALASTCVASLDNFRAPPTAAELTRRRAKGLSPEQDATLIRWGYPYVMEHFRFHITLTGRLAADQIEAVVHVLNQNLSPQLPSPFDLSELALVGEADDGQFHVIERFSLSGPAAGP